MAFIKESIWKLSSRCLSKDKKYQEVMGLDTSSAPAFDESAPSVEDYLENYREKVDALHTLARKQLQGFKPCFAVKTER